MEVPVCQPGWYMTLITAGAKHARYQPGLVRIIVQFKLVKKGSDFVRALVFPLIRTIVTPTHMLFLHYMKDHFTERVKPHRSLTFKYRKKIKNSIKNHV